MKNRTIQAGDVDASTFQAQLEKLAITMTNKIEREGRSRLPKPNYVVTDLGIILRQAVHTYDLLYFLNSDEIQSHSGYRQGYSFAALPLVRTMIDCLYNTTALLAEPTKNGPAFRKSGYRQLLQSIDQEKAEHADDSKWNTYLAEQRDHLLLEAVMPLEPK